MIDFDALNWAGPRGLRDRLKTLIDPRHRRGIRHSVDQILVLALGAVMAGQRTFVGMGDWIRDLRPEQRAVFGCPRWGETFKVPSEPTVRRLLQNLDADALDTVLNQWLTEEELRLGEVLARDGKSLRGSAHGARKRPVHLLSGLLHRTGQVVGPVDVDGKTNEIPQLKVLLDPLDIAGAIVTVDALHTQTETARYVVEDKHAHYVMEVKKINLHCMKRFKLSTRTIFLMRIAPSRKATVALKRAECGQVSCSRPPSSGLMSAKSFALIVMSRTSMGRIPVMKRLLASPIWMRTTRMRSASALWCEVIGGLKRVYITCAT